MTRPRTIFLLSGLAIALTVISSNGHAAEKVGQAIKINVTVTGDSGSMNTGDAVHRNERVRANASGLGQFEFDDGTKLAVYVLIFNNTISWQFRYQPATTNYQLLDAQRVMDSLTDQMRAVQDLIR